MKQLYLQVAIAAMVVLSQQAEGAPVPGYDFVGTEYCTWTQCSSHPKRKTVGREFMEEVSNCQGQPGGECLLFEGQKVHVELVAWWSDGCGSTHYDWIGEVAEVQGTSVIWTGIQVKNPCAHPLPPNQAPPHCGSPL